MEHAISGLDIALWDLLGKALNQPVSRLLGGNYRHRIKPYASILFDEPDVLRDKLAMAARTRLSGHQDGLAPVRTSQPPIRRTIDRDRARKRSVKKSSLMVDAGGSEQFWPHGVAWARETAKMLGDYQHHLVRRSACGPTTSKGIENFAKRRR